MAVPEPIPIMHIVPDGKRKVIVTNYYNIDKIFLHPEVADRKIVVLTTVGAFRKGKSFLLDYCLRFLYKNYRYISNPQSKSNLTDDWLGSGTQPLSGFSWKAGRDADTKGIIIWSDVFLYDSPTEKLAIVVMDTQGLFEHGSSSKENSRIFGLSTLIASIQVINLQELVQEDQIEYLSTATSLSQMAFHKLQGQGDVNNIKLFQKLIFLLRDWSDDKLTFGYEGGAKYLSEFLSQSFHSKESQEVRKHIKDSFEKIECCLLPHPGLVVKKTNFDGCYGQLEGVFVVMLKSFIESILKPSNLVKKSILGREVTGKEFRDYILSYFEAYCSKDIPNVESVLEMTIEKQIKGIIDECVKFYHQKIKCSTVNFEIATHDEFIQLLLRLHGEAKASAINKFKETPKMKSTKSDHEEILSKHIDEFFIDWKLDNLKIFERTLVFKENLKSVNSKREELVKNLENLKEKLEKESQDNAEAKAKAQNEYERAMSQLEEMEQKGGEFQKKLLDSQEESRRQSEANAEARALAQQEIQAAKERNEYLERQNEELKKIGVFGHVGETLDNVLHLPKDFSRFTNLFS